MSLRTITRLAVTGVLVSTPLACTGSTGSTGSASTGGSNANSSGGSGAGGSGGTSSTSTGGSGAVTAGAPASGGAGGTVTSGSGGTGTGGATSNAGARNGGSGGTGGSGAASGSGGTEPSGGRGNATAGASTGGTSAAGSGAGGTSATAGAANGGTTSSMGGASMGCSAGGALKTGDNSETLMVGGIARTYLVHTPPKYDGKTPLPVLFDFHGLSGTGAQQRQLSRWDKMGDSEGFITVFPDGVDNAWNAGICCANDTSIDDVAFVRAMIGELETDGCIDPKRIYASGCSNGGGMSYMLACQAADVIAAVAPVDFDCVDGTGCNMCKPSRPITEVQFRGTSDQLVAYDGNGAFLGAEKNFELWGGLNMCTGDPEALSTNSACQTYPMCGAGTDTVLCTVQDGMHCGNYNSFMITQVAWGVLKDQALP
ncbi:MAG TPA: PHB depolymerase family esterase [Polyangiaceae bacterium]|nr:PHB depolymerase family esterase [Polyangiaceae bacterium]